MPEHPSVEELAYQLWEARGRPHGSAEQDWQTAERQLAAAHHASPSSASSPMTGATAPTASTAVPATGAAAQKALDETLRDSFPASDPPAAHSSNEPPVNAPEKWRSAGVSRGGSAQPSTGHATQAAGAASGDGAKSSGGTKPGKDAAQPAASARARAGSRQKASAKPADAPATGAAGASDAAASRPGAAATPKPQATGTAKGKKPASPAPKPP